MAVSVLVFASFRIGRWKDHGEENGIITHRIVSKMFNQATRMTVVLCILATTI